MSCIVAKIISPSMFIVCVPEVLHISVGIKTFANIVQAVELMKDIDLYHVGVRLVR